MALPDFSTVKGLDSALLGAPFVEGPAKDSISTQSLDYAFLGNPFARNDLAAAGSPSVAVFPARHIYHR